MPIRARLNRLVVALAFTADPVVVGVEPVRVGAHDGEVRPADVGAVQVRRGRRDAEVRVGRTSPSWAPTRTGSTPTTTGSAAKARATTRRLSLARIGIG